MVGRASKQRSRRIVDSRYPTLDAHLDMLNGQLVSSRPGLNPSRVQRRRLLEEVLGHEYATAKRRSYVFPGG